MHLGNLDGITATAVLFMGALIVQSLPDMWHTAADFVASRAKPQPGDAGAQALAFTTSDRDRVLSFGAAVIFGILVVTVGGFGVLSAVGLTGHNWFDGIFTVLVLAAGTDKLSALKSLIGESASTPSTGVVEVSGQVKVTGSSL